MDESKKIVGRPPAFESVEELQERIIQYQLHCQKEDECPGLAGLAHFIGVTRFTLINYSKKEAFFNTIEKAKTWVEYEKERRGLAGKIPPGIFCFDMKNNHGWEDTKKFTHNIDKPIEDMDEETIKRTLKK